MARKQRIENVEQQIENVEAAAPEAAEPTKADAKAKPVCLIDGCGRRAAVRGLCSRCCTAARAAIRRGKVTWETLEAAGLAKAPTHSTGGGQSIFGKALAAAMSNKKD
jgi:hypothetical protein